MQLVLFRHGIAEDPAEGIADAERALTPLGLERTAEAARGLSRLIDRPTRILTSPKTRAAQTAALLGSVFELKPETVNDLASDTPAPILRMLAGRDEKDLLIVGHEPSLSGVVEQLTGARVHLKKAGAAMLEAPLRRAGGDGDGALQWLLTPRALRLLAQAD